MKSEKMKNVIIIVLMLLLVIGGSFLISELNMKSNNNSNGNNNTATTTTSGEDIPESEQKEPTEINIDEYLALKKGSDLAIIYIARPTCAYCVKQTPVLKNVAYLYDLKVNYLNTDEFDEDAYNKLIKSDEYFNEGFGTPLTLLVKDDKIVSKLEGYHEKEDLINFFKENKLIAE